MGGDTFCLTRSEYRSLPQLLCYASCCGAAWSSLAHSSPLFRRLVLTMGLGLGIGMLKLLKDKVRLPQGVFCPVEECSHYRPVPCNVQSTVQYLEAGVEHQKHRGGESDLPWKSQRRLHRAESCQPSLGKEDRGRDTSTRDTVFRAQRCDRTWQGPGNLSHA